MKLKAVFLGFVLLIGGIDASARQCTPKKVQIKQDAGVDSDPIYVPSDCLASGFKIQWKKHPQSSPDSWKVDFDPKVWPCQEGHSFHEDNSSKADTCTITSTLPSHGTCNPVNGMICFKYKVSATTKGTTVPNDPQVIVDNSSFNHSKGKAKRSSH